MLLIHIVQFAKKKLLKRIVTAVIDIRLLVHDKPTLRTNKPKYNTKNVELHISILPQNLT